MSIQYIFELFGTCFFAVSGALAASNNDEHDWFGVTFIGFITAIGGGSLRDILLGSYPLVWISNVQFLYAIIAGVILAKVFYGPLLKLRKMLFLFDTFGISLFTILGTEKALNLGVHPLIAAMMGMFSAVMGGVIRDVLSNQTPVLFRKEIYATACLAGAFLYLGLEHLQMDRTLSFILSGLFIFLIRFVAVTKKLSLPKFKS
ncbi:trimeric intracellular cation channel family protein [Taibaiella lutea]|uniref:Trimeric intracellular cation channel family protein n=1 Tax=Taibaiella lutea TaxID=2608001 RepID=A0A5M6CNT5_9BACT|nr:trimeric intracellular cation channel family protein [Taibaiella lutea]KAA5536737.1 trimeric intracellular cation channel family protein [Taibaiella lutea]